MTIQELMQYIDSQGYSMLDLWENIVRIESWSSDTEGVRKLSEHLDTYYHAMDLETKKFYFPPAGPALAVWTREPAPGARAEPDADTRPIVLMAHMDTVHKPGSFGNELFVRDGEFLRGPGVYDCKGGIVVATLVIRALQHFGYDRRQLRLLLTSDEETAHGISQGEGIRLYSEMGAGAACAFNCESGMMNGDVVTVRKGGSVWKMTVHGIAAHTGRALNQGANAILEASRKIIRIQEQNHNGPVSWNTGVIRGGSGANVVPDLCEVTVSFRFDTNAEYEEAKNKLKEIAEESTVPGTHTGLSESATFKAMETTAGTDRLFELYKSASEELGFGSPNMIKSGGCSDAAYMTIMGIPTLCAVGVRGEDNHALTERAVESSLTEMAKKIVLTILKFDHLAD